MSLYGFTFETFRGDFTQTVTSPESTSVVYRGELHANSVNQARWSYAEPMNKQIFFNEGDITIVEPELEQAILTSVDTTHNLTALLDEIQKDGTHAVEHETTTYTITIQGGMPQSILYTDELDNTVLIEFSNTKRNVLLKEEIFTPQIPPYFDIIRQ
jgi:outer membrane lipoprotein carrier protein